MKFAETYRRRRTATLLFALLALTSLEGCAGSGVNGSTVGTGNAAMTGSKLPDGVAPSQKPAIPPLPTEENLVWSPSPPLDGHPVDLSRTLAPATALIEPGKEMEGYRIQVYSGREGATARRIHTQLQSAGYEAFLYYEAPQYRVRIGNYIEREEAVQACAIIKKQGYAEAWVVKSLVIPTIK